MNELRTTTHSYSSEPFVPSHRQRFQNMLDFGLFLDGRLAAAIAGDKRTALADFELSVERYLDDWVDSNQQENNAPDTIASCVEQYYASAKGDLQRCPEDNSFMILTIMDLWMALDKLTAQQCPLLISYSPEVPQISFIPYSFIAPAPCDVPGLLKSIILKRHQDASSTTSIFSDKATKSSFAVQYFRGSPRSATTLRRNRPKCYAKTGGESVQNLAS
jgi:hypothetical protein